MTRLSSCRIAPFGHPRIYRSLTAPRGFSQLVTSFIGSRCQGIPLVLFVAWPYFLPLQRICVGFNLCVLFSVLTFALSATLRRCAHSLWKLAVIWINQTILFSVLTIALLATLRRCAHSLWKLAQAWLSPLIRDEVSLTVDVHIEITFNFQLFWDIFGSSKVYFVK